MSVWACGECGARYAVGAPRCPQCKANDPREDVQTGVALPFLTVACPGRDCTAYGVQRRVLLRTVAQGVVERPPLHCAACGRQVETVTEEKQEDTDMPKITVHGGASNAAAEPEEGEQPSPGQSSQTSSATPDNSPETNKSEDRSPARKTANRSSKARTGASTARSTDGDPKADADDANDGDNK